MATFLAKFAVIFTIAVYIARPYCGGQKYYLLTGVPSTLPRYSQFFDPDTKAYRCLCPGRTAGDDCDLCSNNNMYKNKDGDCQYCSCSYLSESKQCDFLTGQCDCGQRIEPDEYPTLQEDLRKCVRS